MSTEFFQKICQLIFLNFFTEIWWIYKCLLVVCAKSRAKILSFYYKRLRVTRNLTLMKRENSKEKSQFYAINQDKSLRIILCYKDLLQFIELLLIPLDLEKHHFFNFLSVITTIKRANFKNNILTGIWPRNINMK